MLLFSRLFTSLFLVLFGFFLSSPVFASNVEGSNTLVLSSSFSDTCSWSLQCDEFPDGQYICRTTGESLSAQGGSIQYVPIGKQGTASIPSIGYLRIYSRGIIREKKISYLGPDTYVYPFVRIIKIQV